MTNRIRKIAALTLAAAYLLGIREGKVTLWREGEGHPLQIYDIRADSLPPADQFLLGQGIRLKSREELLQILENYIG